MPDPISGTAEPKPRLPCPLRTQTLARLKLKPLLRLPIALRGLLHWQGKDGPWMAAMQSNLPDSLWASVGLGSTPGRHSVSPLGSARDTRAKTTWAVAQKRRSQELEAAVR